MPGIRQLLKIIMKYWKMLSAAAIAVGLSFALQAADNEAGFKSIFNGRDLTGWDGNPALWSVRDGAITGQTTAEKPTKGNTFIIWRGGEVADFELHLQFKIVGNSDEKWGNSGIQYRSKDKGNWVVNGYQADMECGTSYTGILYEEGGRGILALRGQKVVVGADGKPKEVGTVGASDEIQKSIKSEDWNDYVIIAQGNHLIHKVNGRITMELTDEQPDKRAASGILALQLHAGKPMTVQFKNIRIKTLDAKSKP